MRGVSLEPVWGHRRVVFRRKIDILAELVEGVDVGEVGGQVVDAGVVETRGDVREVAVDGSGEEGFDALEVDVGGVVEDVGGGGGGGGGGGCFGAPCAELREVVEGGGGPNGEQEQRSNHQGAGYDSGEGKCHCLLLSWCLHYRSRSLGIRLRITRRRR